MGYIRSCLKSSAAAARAVDALKVYKLESVASLATKHDGRSMTSCPLAYTCAALCFDIRHPIAGSVEGII